VVEGYEISIFNYRLAQYSDFIDNLAFEMRGLTFVFNEDGSLFNRYLLLHKFFNLNQVPESQYSLVADLGIRSIYNKEDGSVASFIRLPNGSVLGKSKMSFESDQATGMNRLYRTNVDLKRFVDWTLDNDYVAVFEYVAPNNRIVLRYLDEELILLRLRDNKTGEYLDLSKFSKEIGSLKVAPSDVASLDELVELAQSVEDKEGWIVEFSNGLFIKVKTVWYCERHGLLTNDLYREHVLVRYVLDEKIDDVLGQVPEEEVEAHARIEKIIAVVKHAVSEKVKDINNSYELFLEGGVGKDWTGDLRLQLMRKTFAFTIVFALAICGTTLATVCGDSCASSSDCADAGTCRLCIDGTCQHRCAFHNSQDVPFLGAVCGDACSSSSDCSTAGDCRLCIDGICQHRCANDEPV
jgi:T4 RnlA family RNA ligase